MDARFAVRGERPPAELAVVAVDDVTFSSLQRQWPFPRSYYGRAIRRLHAAGAREVVVDVQFTEPTKPEEDGALYDAIDAVGGAVLATSESDSRGRTNVLGGDENLRRIGARAAAANFPDQRGGVIRMMDHSVGRLETIAVAVAERTGHPVSRAAFGARCLDRLPRSSGDRSDCFVLRSDPGEGRPSRVPRQDRRGGCFGAHRAGRAPHLDHRQAAHVGARGPGQRDLDGAARLPAPERALLARCPVRAVAERRSTAGGRPLARPGCRFDRAASRPGIPGRRPGAVPGGMGSHRGPRDRWPW